MELEDGCPRSANEAEKLDGERCEIVEEMAKLKEEGTKTNGSCPDQGEKSKGLGLKKWKRRRREPNKDGGHAQESQRTLKRGLPAVRHAGKAPVSREQSSGNKMKNGGSESSVGNVAASSVHGFIHPGHVSDSGSRNAVVAMSPVEGAIGCGEDQGSKSSTGANFPNGKSKNLVKEELRNEIETKCRPVYEIGIPIEYFQDRKPDLKAFQHRDGSRLAEHVKKARAERNEANNGKSEDPAHEHVGNSTNAGAAVDGFEETFVNHSEDARASASGLLGAGKEENSDELGAVFWITDNNLGSPKVGALGRGKAMLPKRGSYASLNNGTWPKEEIRPWYESFDPEGSTCVRESSKGAQNFDSDERGSLGYDRFKEGEEVRENSVSGCEGAVHSNESFASAVNAGGKKREEIGDSGHPAYRVHLQRTESDCLVQALTQLQIARDAFEKEVQQIKEDLGKGIPLSGTTDSESSTSLPIHVETKHLHELVQPDVSYDAHLKEKGDVNWPSWEGQLSKLDQKLKLLQMELESAHQKALAEKIEVQRLEVLCEDQEVKLKEIELRREKTASELQSLQEKYHEVETELEEQYKGRVQAEIELLILDEASKNDVTLAENEASILKDHKSLVDEQCQTTLKLKDAEDRVLALKDQIRRLENACGSLIEVEEVLTLHNKVCGFSLWSFVQFILLCFAILFMFAQFSQKTPDLVPT